MKRNSDGFDYRRPRNCRSPKKRVDKPARGSFFFFFFYQIKMHYTIRGKYFHYLIGIGDLRGISA